MRNNYLHTRRAITAYTSVFMNSLDAIFNELGISHYLNAFVDQGFDSWETILDITESDLDTLGVKLGHRRKLQRRIANSRGLRPEISLVSPTRATVEDGKQESCRPDRIKTEGRETTGVVTKRKYRRHPKPDENAPERPPSAYVLFSNKMREDLKGRNLTFTEIAKLVGENWQSLSRSEKEPFETQAHDAKERYNRDLADYKKTPDYQKYNEYLQDFRKRQAAQASEKDASKRIKLESDSTRGTSVSTNGISGSNTGSGAGSGSDSQPGSEPPPSRHQRMGSSTSEYPSLPNGMYSNGIPADEMVISPNNHSTFDEIHTGRARGLSSPNSRDVPSYPHHPRRSNLADSHRMSIDSGAGAARPPWFLHHDSRGSMPVPPSISPESSLPSLPSLTPSHSQDRAFSATSASRPPSLNKEQSSAGSMSSLGSGSVPRTPSDASLPIHALLSSKPELPLNSQPSPPLGLPPFQAPSLAHQKSLPSLPPGDSVNSGRSLNGISNTATWSTARLTISSATLTTSPSSRRMSPGLAPKAGLGDPSNLGGSTAPFRGDPGLDGISALLQAKEIVDRRPS